MAQCPTCSRRFGSMRALRVHHTRTHDVRLPNEKCKFCGNHFHTNNKRRYCSDECRNRRYNQEGSNNPNYGKKELETTECEICGSTFEFYPSAKKGLYCPTCVENEEWRDVPDPAEGKDNPRWKGGKVEVECDACGDQHRRWPANVNIHNFVIANVNQIGSPKHTLAKATPTGPAAATETTDRDGVAPSSRPSSATIIAVSCVAPPGTNSGATRTSITSSRFGSSMNHPITTSRTPTSLKTSSPSV